VSTDLTLVLRRACDVRSADSCAVVAGQRVVAASGATLPWPQVLAMQAEQGERFLAAPPELATALLGAAVPVRNHPDMRAVVIRLLGAELAQKISKRAGLEVRIVSYRSYAQAPADAFARLHAAALADGRSAAAHIDRPDLYVASYPVFAATGEAIALLEARLPAADIDTSVGRLVRRLLAIAGAVGVIAILAGVFLGRRVASPVRDLTDAAVRLGHGDFSTSIPARGTAEVGALAHTMEEMRRSLVDLTGALRRREAEARALLGGIVEGVFAVDEGRRIRFLNPQAEKLLGVRSDEAAGRFCGDVLKPCATDGVRPCESLCPILGARTAGSARAVERLCPTGDSPRTTVITSAASADGLQVQVMRDETELEAVRRARDTVLANISHEFRTPLAAQLASIELLRDGVETMAVGERRELLYSLERGALRLTRLIDNLLESVRIESGQLGIRRQPLALGEVVADAAALIHSLMAQRRQTLVIELPADLPALEGDGPRLTQVFVNLFANASKYAPEGSAVRVGAGRDAGTLSVWVEDEGPGVPEGERGVIFERFRRSTGEEPEPGGLGLGLWICKSIIERHGGTIGVARTAEGRTRFTATLPLGAGA
jgi:signal transduction histidine kinase/HAMP domain-containing protein